MVFLALLCFSLIRIAALLALSHYEVCRLLVCRITRFFAYWVCRIMRSRLLGLSHYEVFAYWVCRITRFGAYWVCRIMRFRFVAYWVCRIMRFVALLGLSHYDICCIMPFVAF